MGMSFRSRFAVLALALGVSVGVMGQGAMAAKVGNIDVSGYVDVYGAFNMNTPAVIGTPFHLFEPAEGAALNRAEIVFDHPMFRLDLGYGPTDAAVSGFGTTANAQQLFIKWPVEWMGRSIQIDAGKFVTHMGTEVIESKDNWLYSRGLLFQYAIPYFHTGIRATGPINDTWWGHAALVNGWNNIAAVTRSPAYCLQVGGKPMGNLTTILNYIGGTVAVAGSTASVIDIVVSYDVNSMLSLGLNYDTGSVRAAAAGAIPTYSAFALYGKYALATGTVALRYESFSDPSAAFVGVAQLNFAGGATTVSSITVGYDVPLQKNTTGRVEYRVDSATPGTPFTTSAGAALSGSSSAITAGLVTTF